MSETPSPKSRRAERSLATICTRLLQMDVSPYLSEGVVPLTTVADALLGTTDTTGRRPVYTIFNVAVGCGALVPESRTLFRWSPHVAGMSAESAWHDVLLEVRHQQLHKIEGAMALTARIMRRDWTGGRSVSDIADDLEVKTRRVYEVAALLACLGVMERKAYKASYQWNRECRLKAPEKLPKRQAESPPSSIETRATRRRRREQQKTEAEQEERGAAARKLFPQLGALSEVPDLPGPITAWHAPFEVPEEVLAFDAALEEHALTAMIY